MFYPVSLFIHVLFHLRSNIQYFSLNTFEWDNHFLQTYHNLTSNQLWTIRLLQKPVDAPDNLEVQLKNIDTKQFAFMCNLFPISKWNDHSKITHVVFLLYCILQKCVWIFVIWCLEVNKDCQVALCLLKFSKFSILY